MQRQKISGVVRFEADGLFERCDNQAHNNHIGQIVVQALEALHLLRYLETLDAWVDAQFAHLFVV